MIAKIENARPSVVSAELTDAHEMAAVQREAQVEYLSLAPGKFRARLTSVDLGAIRLQDANDDAHLTRGAIAPGRLVLLFASGPIGPGLRVNGATRCESDVCVLPAKAELYTAVLARQRWSAVVLDENSLADIVPGETPAGSGRSTVQCKRLADFAGLREISAAVFDLACRDPSRLAQGSVPESLIESLSAVVARGLSARTGVGGRAEKQRVQLISRVDEAIDAAIGRPIYTAELCAMVGASVRTLHEAFTAVYGMSVHRYLRLRRLNLARAALRHGDRGPSRVKSVALELGFWHLGRFARDYRGLFGESPSDTLRGALRRRNAQVGRVPSSRDHAPVGDLAEFG